MNHGGKGREQMAGDEKYLAAVGMLGGRLAEWLRRAPPELQARVTEIRLREGRPVCLMTGNRTCFLSPDGEPLEEQGDGVRAERGDLRDAFVSVCGWAVHSHQKELTEGFVAVRGGHRAGIAATAVVQDGRVTAVRDVTSINLRVAREIYGAADRLVRECFTGQTPGVLIAGAPASGKTTILRDLARQLAGAHCGYRKVCVVDESGEIGGASAGGPANDLGMSADLLSGYPKAQGLRAALRYLSPQVMICDEICTSEEIGAVAAAANSGVAVVTSVHAAGETELIGKPQLEPLLRTGVFSYFALLAGADAPAQIARIGKAERLCRC